MSNKIKILHIQETIASGGVERLRLSLARHLDKARYEQKIICTNASGHIVDEIESWGVEIIPLGVPRSVLDRKKMNQVQRIIADFKPDIIHGAVFEGVTWAAVNGFLMKVPVIIIEETSDPQTRSWRGNLLMKLFAKLSHKVIGVSEAVTSDYLLGKLNLSRKKIITVNNGVAVPRTISLQDKLKARSKWKIGPDDFVVGSAGRMLNDDNKRFSDLIKAFGEFAEGKPNVKLLLVGDGPERKGYEKLVEELDVVAKVIFAGYQQDVTLFYNLMDVFSLVSRNEAFGLVLAEAMLNKLPVVATKVGGMRYIVDDKKTGFLVNPYEISQTAGKFETLYKDASLCSLMGIRGYEKAMTNFTEEIYVSKIEKLYIDLLTKKGILHR